jgi:hypothetical protein
MIIRAPEFFKMVRGILVDGRWLKQKAGESYGLLKKRPMPDKKLSGMGIGGVRRLANKARVHGGFWMRFTLTLIPPS